MIKQTNYMRKTYTTISLCLLLILLGQTATAQTEKEFKNPPADLCSHVILGWDGEITPDIIGKDLNEIRSRGFRNVIVEAGYRMGAPYLSEGWMANIRTLADSAAHYGMRVWIIDEGKYPSGMAGGLFSKERPDLCMQALVPEGDTVRAVRRSSQTRCVNNPTGGKDESNSLCDYLDPQAVGQFISWTHEAYRKALGHHLGTTVLGFRGDEPAFQRVPWTNDIMDVFVQEKGYDPTPWLRALTQNSRSSLHFDGLSDRERQVKADYWDVWSRLFADRFFKAQADWCASHGVSHITHMDKDDMLPWCVKMEGDPFRCLSQVQVPGIDVIWSQIWYGCRNEFPRMASSVAHVYGRQRAFSESFAAYSQPLTTASVRYIVDYQLARGINFFEFMFWQSKRGARGYMAEPGMPALNDYVNRAGYLLSKGRPAGRTAIYVPIPSIWLGDDRSYDWMKAAAHLLAAHQYDFDFITDDGIIEATTPRNGQLVNRSGQAYETLVIPSSQMLREKAWEKISEFAARGGKVIYMGEPPAATFAATMTAPQPIVPIKNALMVSDSTWTDRIEQYLPVRDMTVVKGRADSLICCARQQDDGKVFFILNQRGEAENATIDLDCMGEAQQWNAETGEVTAIPYSVADNKTRLQLQLPAWGSIIIKVKKRTTAYHVQPGGNIQAAIDKAHSEGGGTIVLNKGKHPTGALFFPRGTDLHIERGAELISIVDTTLYPIITTRWEGRMQKARAALLNFNDNEGCRLTGEGLIDAKGLEWKKLPIRFAGRPKTICFNHCDGGTISGVSVRNQAFWCVHILFTNGFTVDGIHINAEDYIPSSDGIDIDSSTGVVVRNAHIRAHDDCISIKSGKDTDGRRVNKASEDIIIENCHFDYGHGGVAIGSEVSGDVRRVVVRHCDMAGENWNPIRFKSQPSRGGVVEDILFDDIRISKARNVVEINMAWRMKGADEPPYSPRTTLRNIRLHNITAKAESGGLIRGYEEQPIPRGAITFDNCSFDVKTPIQIEHAEVEF